MISNKEQLKLFFTELNQAILILNQERQTSGQFKLPKAKVQLLGQLSLMVNEKASLVLSLTQTADVDATLEMDFAIKTELKKLLTAKGMVYDEDSYLIWIPPKSKFTPLFDLENIWVECIDAESALVSKAVRAPKKNRQLIRQAIASDSFSNLVDRILANGGKVEYFA